VGISKVYHATLRQIFVDIRGWVRRFSGKEEGSELELNWGASQKREKASKYLKSKDT